MNWWFKYLYWLFNLHSWTWCFLIWQSQFTGAKEELEAEKRDLIRTNERLSQEVEYLTGMKKITVPLTAFFVIVGARSCFWCYISLFCFFSVEVRFKNTVVPSVYISLAIIKMLARYHVTCLLIPVLRIRWQADLSSRPAYFI